MGEEQLAINYIESLLNLSGKMQGEQPAQEIRIQALSKNLSKLELKKIITAEWTLMYKYIWW